MEHCLPARRNSSALRLDPLRRRSRVPGGTKTAQRRAQEAASGDWELAATKEQGAGRRPRSRPLRTGIPSPGPAIALQHEIEPMSSERRLFGASSAGCATPDRRSAPARHHPTPEERANRGRARALPSPLISVDREPRALIRRQDFSYSGNDAFDGLVWHRVPKR
jgi:hypothetical protein